MAPSWQGRGSIRMDTLLTAAVLHVCTPAKANMTAFAIGLIESIDLYPSCFSDSRHVQMFNGAEG